MASTRFYVPVHRRGNEGEASPPISKTFKQRPHNQSKILNKVSESQEATSLNSRKWRPKVQSQQPCPGTPPKAAPRRSAASRVPDNARTDAKRKGEEPIPAPSHNHNHKIRPTTLENENNARHSKHKQRQQRNKTKGKNRRSKPKNTESFQPCYAPPSLRLIVGEKSEKFGRSYTVNDVVVVRDFFCNEADQSAYEDLLTELKRAGKDRLFTLWHGDSHMIADDKKMGGRWKNQSPTFQKVVAKISKYFDMDIKATRFNWYRNSLEWKPYHHDRAAFTPNCPQNLTVAISFGNEREVSFLHAKGGSTINIPLPNGTLYAFGRDVNIAWKHGIVPIPPQKQHNQGRISIIAWGWNNQFDENKQSEKCQQLQKDEARNRKGKKPDARKKN